MKKQTHYVEGSDLSSGKSDLEIMNYEKKLRSNKRNKKSVQDSKNRSNGQDHTTVIDIEETPDNRYWENMRKSSSKFEKSGRLQRSSNINVEPDESDSEHLHRKSIDIVVDVHCENEISKKKPKEKHGIQNGNMKKELKANSTYLKEGIKSADSQDSLDLIEEIRDSPNQYVDNEKLEGGFEESSSNDGKRGKSWMEEAEPTSSEVSGRRRWQKVEDSDRLADNIRKARRKRWAKNDETATDNSVSSNYMEFQPKPAPRRSVESRESVQGLIRLEDGAFLPDTEEDEVLTIETNYYKQDTKIEMSLTSMKEAANRNYDGNETKQGVREEYEEELSLSEKVSIRSVELERPKSGLEKRNNFIFGDEEKGKLKTKKRSKSVDELERRSRRGDHKTHKEETISSFSDDDMKRPRKKRSKSKKTKKRTRKHRSKSAASRRSPSPSVRAERSKYQEKTKTKEAKKKSRKGESVKFISVMVHKCEMLEIDYITRHPMVKIHIVNAKSGEYVKNDGNSNPEISFLQPVITGKFDFKDQKSMTPVWEEEVIFEHDFRALFLPEPDNVLILFEIVDLMTFSEASHSYDRYGSESCWYKVAWAFLKILGTNGDLHINKKLRLQLFRPPKSRVMKRIDKTRCEIFEWWTSKVRKPYPSSLYVTVSPVEQPKLVPVFYDQLTFNESSDLRSDSQLQYNRTSESESMPIWSRLADQPCKIPTEIAFETEVSENGCFYVTFSNTGKYLAYVASEENNFPIFVYKNEDARIHVRFNGHKYFVYALAWSHDDYLLLSVSSDQTARIWDVREKIIQYIFLLPHPSYVYSGKFDIETTSIVATGCYDNVVRIWCKSKKSKSYELVQELDIHLGFINAMCFLEDNTLLTADSVGLIVSWVANKIGKRSFKKEWVIFKEIKIKEIQGTIINSIFPHPKENKLLIHSRKHSLILFNLSSGEIVQRFAGLENERIQISSCISPCGNLVFCGGEDSTLNIWNANSGKHLAKYVFYQSCTIPVTSVSYHLFEHMLACSTFETPSPVRVLKYERNSTGETIGLIMFEDGEQLNLKIHQSLSESSLKSLKNRSKRNSASILEEDDLNSGSTSNLLENDEQTSLVMKLQRFIETMPIPQFGNSNKMNSIMEKIDRILSNASSSRSADDVESGKMPEHSLRLDLKSTGSELSGETVRLKDFEPIKKTKRTRPRSAKSVKSSCYSRKLEDMRNILSEGPLSKMGSMDVLVDDDELNLESSMATTSFYVDERYEERDNKAYANFSRRETKDENLDSDGTYIVEKGDIEQNDDPGSSGDSSVKSNVTFTIENEVPVVKPRRYKN